MAGAAWGSLYAAARLHGLSAIPGKPLALRMVAAPELVPRIPLLARSVLTIIVDLQEALALSSVCHGLAVCRMPLLGLEAANPCVASDTGWPP
jgi:hypothetical protein